MARERPRHKIRALMVALPCIAMILLAAAPKTLAAQPAATPTPSGLATVNVELILDSSGSMAEILPEGQSRIDAAKEVLRQVIAAIPEREGINVGFRVYGHEGSNTEAGKAVSCRSTELRVPVEGVDKRALLAEVERYRPVGWTPIALSLREAASDFEPPAANEANFVVLVTDGLETCGGDPCAASRMLKRSAVAVTTHVISLALSEEEQANLQCIVDESGGMLLGADSAEELAQALFTILQEIEVVVTNGILEIEAIGGVFPKATVELAEESAAGQQQGTAAQQTLTEQNRLELAPGRYRVRWTNPSGEETHVVVEIEPGKTTVIRGSILRLPHGAGESYLLKAQDGTVIWRGPIEYGDAVWVLPGIYRLEVEQLTGDAVIISLDVQTLPGAVTEVSVTTSP